MPIGTEEIFYFKPKIIWDLQSESPELFRFVSESNHWLHSSHQELQRHFPATKNYSFFMKNGFLRLNGHVRAFYQLGPGHEVLAIKGSEPLAETLGEKLQGMAKKYNSILGSILELFVIREQKAPMALLESEALLESRKALAFQEAYLQRFGKLAQTPLPLLVARLPRKALDHYRSQLFPLLSDCARGLCDSLLGNNLAVYVYYYPSIPVRAAHTSNVIAGKMENGYKERMKSLQAVNKMFHPDFELFRVLDQWCELVVDMLELGYFPCNLSDYYTGICIAPQNCVVDGGFVDLGSLCLMREIEDDLLYQETFYMMLNSFVKTATKLFVGSEVDSKEMHTSIQSILRIGVFEELGGKLEQRAEKGILFDPRLVELFRSMRSFKGIDSLLARTLAT